MIARDASDESNFEEELMFVGQLALIRAVNPGGPRYNPNITEHMLNQSGNLIVLCDTHHRLVEAHPDLFPASGMQRWIDGLGRRREPWRSRVMDRIKIPVAAFANLS